MTLWAVKIKLACNACAQHRSLMLQHCRTLDQELKAACHIKDPAIDVEWQNLSFILQLSARANSEFLAKAQSALRNAKLMAETSSWNVFKAELETDQVYHKTQMALQSSEVAKRKTALVETLSSFHYTAWRMVQGLCESSFPTWAILTRELGEQLPAKLASFLDQVLPLY